MRVIESDARINWIVAEEGRQHSPQLANPNAASARRPEAPRGAAPSFTCQRGRTKRRRFRASWRRRSPSTIA